MKWLLKLFIITTLLSTSFAIEIFYKKEIKQGETATILVRAPKRLNEPYITYNGKKLPLINIFYSPEKHVYRSLIGTDPKTSIETKEVKIYQKDKFLKKIIFTVTDGEFESEYINLPKEKKKLITNTRLVNEGTIIGNKFKTITKPAKWRGGFIMPSKGRISSSYGMQRKYNKDKLAWWHKGIDIANVIGTPIVAPNDGNIILTTTFDIHGKTVMLNHGHGVVSIFNHMNSINVKNGQFVKRGTTIGTIGNTGSSTGPHVHWGLSVNNTRVNPMQWVNKKFAPNYRR